MVRLPFGCQQYMISRADPLCVLLRRSLVGTIATQKMFSGFMAA